MTSLTKGISIGIIAVILLLVTALGVLVGAGLYGWKAAQRAGNEAATVQNLKTIAAVEIQYFNTQSRTFGTFDEMVNEGMLSNRFAGEDPTIDDYIFTLKVTPKTARQSSSYTLNADPQSDKMAKSHFYIDSNSSTIHFNRDHAAGAADPPLGE